MNLKNNQVISAIVFILIWVFVLVMWGSIKDIKADRSSDRYVNEKTDVGNFNHPLWND